MHKEILCLGLIKWIWAALPDQVFKKQIYFGGQFQHAQTKWMLMFRSWRIAHAILFNHTASLKHSVTSIFHVLCPSRCCIRQSSNNIFRHSVSFVSNFFFFNLAANLSTACNWWLLIWVWLVIWVPDTKWKKKISISHIGWD